MQIELSKGYAAEVDADVYDFISQFKWYARVRNHTVYVQHSYYKNHKIYTISLHRLLMEMYEGNKPGMDVDHKDHNGLNNTRDNLRYVSHRENTRNRKRTSAVAPCVRFNDASKRYTCHTYINGKTCYVGTFLTLEAAIEARDKATIGVK